MIQRIIRFLRLMAMAAVIFQITVPQASAQTSLPHARSGVAMWTVSDTLDGTKVDSAATSNTVRMATLLTILSIGPALIISMTAFIRIIIVISMIRHAFGMPETPPTPVLISLALFLTVFAMFPTLEAINHNAFQPFMSGQLGLADALDRGAVPLREFMLRQVRDDELKLTYQLSGKALPQSPDDVSLLQLTPAFILNELRVAFQIGFVVLLPFLLIDLVVSSVLLSLGMLMVPPATISLPLKVLMFVLIDGWGLVLKGVLGSFR